jgi:all-trans-8'-apo-beta-carotenal 15,15'-oxygenase
MNRRELVCLAAAAGISHFPGAKSAHAQLPADVWSAAFKQAAVREPWTLGYQNGSEDLADRPAQVRGRFPLAVQGVLFRNGPALHELGGQRYHHWFDGDGMVQRFEIGAETVTHSGRMVRTAKYTTEMAAGKRLLGGFGSQWTGMKPTSSPDALNAANTGVLPLGDKLLALWEGGSAYQLDPRSLRTIGPKVWRSDLAGLPFSAHPRVDPDGTVWNFGTSVIRDMLLLYQIDSQGQLRRAEALQLPESPYVHDFAVTQHHLVFLMPPMVFDHERAREGKSFLDSHVWRPKRGMRVLLVDKSDWSQKRWLELPSGFLFHIGNAWEDPQGLIHLDYIHSNEPTALLRTDRDLMRGRVTPRPDYHIASVRIDPVRATAEQELIKVDAEFPRIDPRLSGQRHIHLLHATQTSTQHPGFSAVARTNVETGRTDRYSYGQDHMAEEHLFVAEPGTAPGDAGWILGTALDMRGRRTLLSCFRSDRLGDGPVAQATLPYALPLGLHGAFTRA